MRQESLHGSVEQRLWKKFDKPKHLLAMGYLQDKEEEELKERYPEGSIERRVLDYSRDSIKDSLKHKQEEEVPPLLLAAFKLLMGITIVMSLVSLVAFLSAH